MPRIIPNDLKLDRSDISYGEIQIYEALEKLPDEYIIFYSLHWNKKSKYKVEWGESDFTVFHPKKGILVIEVKSGKIKCKDGKWEQTNTKTLEMKLMKDPMVQAERSKHAFIDLLEKNNSREYRVECAVWFTSAENYSVLGDLPPVYKEGNLLVKNDIANIEKAINRVFDYYGFRENPFYDKNDEKNVIRKLSPEFDIIPSISNIIEEGEYYFNRMTREQTLLIEYLDEQKRAAIQGGAGTGKTMLALEKARRLSENEDTENDKVLFLCFNEFLHHYLKNRYRKELPNVYFFSIDKLVKKHYRIAGEYSSKTEKIDFLNNYSDYGWDYRHIIIDEGQDFAHEEIEALHTIAELEDSCFYIFYDKNQVVNKDASIFNSDRIDCRLILTANCRNTKKIALSSNKILNIDKYRVKDNVEGITPKYFITGSRENIISILEREIKRYTEEKISYDRIVILTVKTEKKSVLANIDKIGSYKIRHNLEDKGILFTTSRKYKGLESDIVFVIDIDREIFENETGRRVLHVAASRAKHMLNYISCLTEEEKLDICEVLTGKRNRKSNSLIGEALEAEIIEVDCIEC